MNDHEAKFRLRALRPDSSDAQDPLFAEALAQAENNPSLKEWLEREKTFDRTVAAKLRDIQPPAGLRDAILAGSRVSQRPRAWWRQPAWLAVAASVVITLTLALGLRHTGPSAHDFAEFAIHDLATDHASHTYGQPDFHVVETRVANTALPFPANTKLDAAELRRLHCHTVNFDGQEIFELCFERDGKWFHIYAAPVNMLSAGSAIARSLVMTKGSFTATAWKDANFAYALVTEEGPEALRKLL